MTTGKSICSSCCGSKRGTEIDCSPDCTYSPLSIKGYDLWLKTDSNLSRKMLGYIIDVYGGDHFKNVMSHMSFKNPSPEYTEYMETTAGGAAAYFVLFVERGKNNQTLAECWKDAGWKGLNNDERALMNCRFNSRATIIEIQKILDNQAMECIDLLDPQKGQFILLDRSTAKNAVRFTRVLTWLTHYPHFSRTENNGVVVTDMIAEEFMEILQESFKKESKKYSGFTLKDYLSENFGAFCELTFELAREKQVAILKRMDVHQCKALYRIEGKFSDIKAILDNYPDFEIRERNPEEKPQEGAYYYSWLRKGGSKALEKEMSSSFRHDDESQGVGTIGNITLSPDKMIIEVFSKQKFKFAKKMVSKYFKGQVSLQNELVVDMAKQIAGRIDGEGELRNKPSLEKPAREPKALPIEIERKIIKDFHKRHYEKFIDEQIPALDNMTPREAAKDPKMRPRLISLMKQHLKGIDIQNKEKDLGLDINWILDELGLIELK